MVNKKEGEEWASRDAVETAHEPVGYPSPLVGGTGLTAESPSEWKGLGMENVSCCEEEKKQGIRFPEMLLLLWGFWSSGCCFRKKKLTQISISNTPYLGGGYDAKNPAWFSIFARILAASTCGGRFLSS